MLSEDPDASKYILADEETGRRRLAHPDDFSAPGWWGGLRGEEDTSDLDQARARYYQGKANAMLRNGVDVNFPTFEQWLQIMIDQDQL